MKPHKSPKVFEFFANNPKRTRSGFAWLRTRQDWVAAAAIFGSASASARRPGKAVTVESIGLKAGEHRVYNLEVEQEHQFYVGESGVLVHNAYDELPPKGTLEGDAARYDRYVAGSGDLSYDEWYPLSRGGRGGDAAHSQIQNALEAQGYQTEYQIGDRWVDAYTEGEIHQIGELNGRGDPVARERDAINDILNSPEYNNETIYFWDKKQSGRWSHHEPAKATKLG